MVQLGESLIVVGLCLGLLDMLLITLMPRNPLPPAVGLLMPVGVVLGFIGGYVKGGLPR